MTKHDKVRKTLIEKIYSNGGHWAEFNMKKGGKLIVQRRAQSQFERLEYDSFNVFENNWNNKVMSNAEIGSVVNFMIEY